MHETNSKNFLGYIDSTEVVNDFVNELNKDINPTGTGYKTVGWVVDVTKDDILTENDFTVTCKSQPVRVTLGINLIDRPDVKKFYIYNDSNKYLKSGFDIAFDALPGTYSIKIRGIDVFSVTVPRNIIHIAKPDDPVDSVLEVNNFKGPELIVVDNFYKDPDKVRDYALQQEFKANEKYHKGSRTEKQYIPSWAKAEFSKLLNKEVTEFVGATGVFQYCVAKDNVVYHYDTQMYAAMVYLSPDAPLETGTRTLKSKITGLMTAATDEDAIRLGRTKEELDMLSFNGNNFYDKNNFEIALYGHHVGVYIGNAGHDIDIIKIAIDIIDSMKSLMKDDSSDDQTFPKDLSM
jgi:hypothetical protein